jgi:hypothetical protein
MGFWRCVDWQRPWLAPYRAQGEALCRALDRGADLREWLNRTGAAPVRFVPQAELPAGDAYEAFIARSGCVPTRDNLHDLFNGLVWLQFPALKRHLNALQAEQIAAIGIASSRGVVRDALTVFDENAAFWQAPRELVDALGQRDWVRLFITQRRLWSQARLTLFGHALLEKLTQPRKAITAHVWVVPTDLDASGHRACTLTPQVLAAKPHLPLPVLGVPGWWDANEAPGFYDDNAVFRLP